MPCNFFLIAGHEVLGKKSYCKQVFSNVAVRCQRWEAFCSPRIRSQSFSKPVPLDCELHKCFLVSFCIVLFYEDKCGMILKIILP